MSTMTDYTYTGIDKTGRRVTGSVAAPNEGDLRVHLRTKGIRPTQIRKGKKGSDIFGSMFTKQGPKVPFEPLFMFTRQLQVLVGAGIPLIQALETLADQANNANLKKILIEIRNKVSEGSYFWEAISVYPQAFGKLYISLIRAGEASGSLDAMLSRITSYMEDADRLRKLLKGAMIYPIAVVSIGILVISVMLIFVIPKFEELLKSNGQVLPAPTQFIIDASHFLIANIVYIIVGGGAALYTFLRWIKTPEGKGTIDRLFFNFPVFGPIMQKGAIARFSRTMQTLLSSGVSLLDAIDICKATIDNAVVEVAVGKIRAEVEAGNRLGVVVSKLTVFPKMAVQMIMVGESSGSLDQMLDKVADFYEAEVETMVGGMSKLIEPFILVFLGGAVGFMLISMYLPIFKMASGPEGQ